MIKVLIVDDERLVRVGIRSSIPWEEYGFTVIDEACNGEEALMKIQTLHPDLILTDIRMPKMDGLQLLQEMDRRNLQTETIIMSCYNEFELAQSAMRYGASDYLLKLSVSDEELLEVLNRSKQRILSHRRQSGNQFLYGENDLREKFSKLVLHPETPFSELSGILQHLHANLEIENMALCILSADHLFERSSLSYSPIDRQTVSLIENLLHDDLVSQKCGDAFILNQSEGHFLVCLNMKIPLHQAVTDIQNKIKEYFNLTLSICILENNLSGENIFSFVKPALSTLQEKKFRLGRNCIFKMEDISPRCSYKVPISITEAMGEIRGVADLNKLNNIVHCLKESMTNQRADKSTCLSLFSELFYKVADILHTYRGTMNGLTQNCGINLIKSLQQLEFLEDSEIWFKMYIQYIIDYLTVCESNWKRSEILLAIDYINKNYHLPITSQKVARIAGISEAYFSTLFKKETGNGFIEYLTDLRMEKAKQLLEDKNVSITEVCEYVGYSDPNYFGKVFKKYTGFSPNTYRKNRIGSGN